MQMVHSMMNPYEKRSEMLRLARYIPFRLQDKNTCHASQSPLSFGELPRWGAKAFSPSYGTFLTSAPSPKMDKPQYYSAMIFGNSRLMTSAIMRFIFQSP